METSEQLTLSMLWSLGTQTTRDRRRSPRVLDEQPALAAYPAEGEASAVRVLDVSADGASLLYPTLLPAGQHLRLELPRPVLSRIIYCLPREHRFRIGTAFVGFIEGVDQPKTELEAGQSQTPTQPEWRPTPQMEPQRVSPGGKEPMSATTQTEGAASNPFSQWLHAGESLYADLLKEFQSLQEKLSELESTLQQKGSEVNQIAQVLGKPVLPNTRLAAELVSNHMGEMRTSDEALRIRPPSIRPVAAAARASK